MIKIFNGITIIFGILLLLCCLVPFIPVNMAPYLSFLALGTPLIVFANIGLLLVAMALRTKVGWFILLALIISFLTLETYFMFGNTSDQMEQDGLSVMSYNILGFDKYDLLKGINEVQEITALVAREDPDIVCFQEFGDDQRNFFPQYPFKYINFDYKNDNRSVQAIFSKYPIVRKGSLEFPETLNNAVFADIVYKNDTIRVYNIHLQSYKVIPSRRLIKRLGNSGFYRRMANAFVKQQEQAVLVKEHRATSPYLNILCGDFNNTQFSRVYRMLKASMNDSYEVKGRGFGTTYSLKFIPLRIDAIMADPAFEVLSHTNYQERHSDHYPLMATFRIKEKDSSNQ